ncbi:hypothetical protein CROQUDRAFT_658445 [Cronartium quercuum f. sp. fusiforme G11]|uniref:4a-hydroxytetrahydrobiopterin dehydratase n=1 Tax=Cronartium quercuum f. sp. fusiforme G11 TaxID=708437 RepID=A0A9P6NLD3_9BASI|nr:hypothetical protein CROQUDRAFT_658445 [Cronartium quercuum f. sp. fusiforme G11]
MPSPGLWCSLSLSKINKSSRNITFNSLRSLHRVCSEASIERKKTRIYKTRADIDEVLNQKENSSLIRSGWKVIPIQESGNDHWALRKTLNQFKTWGEAIGWIHDQVRPIADECKHHPDINLTNYNQLNLTLFTHSLNGLTPRDLRLALKIDQLNVHSQQSHDR